KHRPTRRNRQSLDVRRDCWNVSSVEIHTLAYLQSCAKRFYGSHNWRNGHRERASCARNPPTLRSGLTSVRQRELRSSPPRSDRVRVIWARKGRVHRRDSTAFGSI